MPLKLLLDTATNRVKRTPLSMKDDGRTWTTFADTFLDPITYSTFLRPQVLHPDWETSATGDMARLSRTDYQKADTTALPAGDWVENNLRIPGDIYLESRGVNYAVFTAAQPINQPVFLSIYIPQGKGQKDTTLECGWGEPGAEGTVSLRVRGSGSIEVWKGAALVGNLRAAGLPAEALRNLSGRDGQISIADAATPGGGDVVGRFLNLYMFPCRRNQLLVFSSAGGGGNHVFTDLDSSVVNTITPAGRFWWYVAAGKASVQCAPMIFPTFGYVLGRIHDLREAPHVGETFDGIIAGDDPGTGGTTITGGAVETDGSTPFTGDDVLTQARIRVELTGDGTNTPSVYAGDAAIGSYIVSTDDSEVADLSDHLTSFEFFVGENPSATRGTFELRGPEAIAAFCAGISEQSNRPFELWISDDGVTWRLFFMGFVGQPKAIEAARFEDGGGNLLNDRAFRIVLPWQDRWRIFEELEYEDDVISPDDLVFTDYVETLIQDAGILPGEIDIESNAFRFGYTVGASRGEWVENIEKGTSIARLLELWQRDYATSWYMRMRPSVLGTYDFLFHSEATLPSTAEATASLDPLPGDKAVRRFEEETIPPEVTRVAVFGYDPTARVRLRARLENNVLENPATPPSSRPAGWIGTVHPLYVEDPRFRTQSVVERAADVMYERLAVVRKVAEWQSDLLRDSSGVPLWRGNVVGIVGKGLYRIEAFSGTLKNESIGFIWRDINYVGKRIGAYP